MKYYLGLKRRETPRKINKYVVSGIFLILGITLYWSAPAMCKIYAYSSQDFCWQYSVQIENSGAPVSLAPVYMPNINSNFWVSSEYIDDFGWSLYNYQGSESVEIDAMFQDFPSINSSLWYVVPVINTGGDNVLTSLMGANDVQRNQGMYFYEEDYLIVNNHNDFNQSVLDLKFEIADPIAPIVGPAVLTDTSTIIEKYDDNTTKGFKVLYERYGSYVNVKAYVDNWYIEDTFVPVQHENNIIEVSLSSNNYLNLTINGVSANPVSNAFLLTNTEDLYMGVNYDGSSYTNYAQNLFLRYMEIVLNNNLVAYYGFNPTDINQTSATDPDYGGNIEDISGNSHIAVYDFYRPQNQYNLNVSNISQSSTAGNTIFSSQTADILGKWYGSGNPNQLNSTNENLIGLSFLEPPNNLGLPDALWYSLWLSAFGVVLALGMFWVTNSIPVSMFASSGPLIIGSIQGLITNWFLVVWFLLFFGIYSTYQWFERS